jgi:2'-5' RNA ligase
MRTFIAIELPGAILDLLKTVQGRLKSEHLDFKWVQPENIHLTLRFLGDISPEMVPKIENAMEQAAKGVAPFTLLPKGLGAFPGLHRPRVLWMGVGGDTDQLQKLYRSLTNQLEIAGLEKETRPYAGHLTLGRAKDRIDPVKFIDCVKKHRDFGSAAFAVREMIMIKSTLQPAGPVYEKMFRVKLS